MTDKINLCSLLWAHRVAFACVVTGTVIATLVFLWLSTPLYRAVAVVAPTESVPTARSLSRVSSLMGLTGLGLREDVQTFAIFRYLLHSPELARTIPNSDSILRSIYYRQWDSEHQVWNGPGVVVFPTPLVWWNSRPHHRDDPPG